MRESLGLIRSRKQDHTVASIQPAMRIWGFQGSSLVMSYFQIHEADLVRVRRQNRLRRKRFWAAGSNDILAVDQHDKWKYKFGLALHSGIDPFVGKIHWMKIWWSNSNPRLILSYYLDHVQESGHMPLVTQSDPGNENFGMANGHTLLRHWHDPALKGTLQHRWMNKKNVMPEIGWSQLRRRFTPGFEDILDMGVNNDWYDPDNLLEALVFRWIFIPWLQQELDAYRDRINNTAKRADKNKVLPHGVPNLIAEHPEDYGVLDFKVKVEQEAVDHVRALYAPPDHQVFELVPPEFHTMISAIYALLGQPDVTCETCWGIYKAIVLRFRSQNLLEFFNADAEWGYAMTMARGDHVEDVELLPNLKPLLNGDSVISDTGYYYMGGVNNGAGLGTMINEMLNEDEPIIGDDDEFDEIIAPFTSDEEDAEGTDGPDEW
ncbi:hypothetical protein C8J57DRAFT_1620785 [Mycena rebaudengoi]|nr:hypothetical protein C8J57DRAFT_1620785 [Mycena rebaudengoi]